jgi:Rieske Fe-S protein
MDESTSTPPPASRRTILGGAAVIGIGAVLAACEGTDASGGGDSHAKPSNGAGGETSLGKTSDVPVGSGIIVADAKAVVTQPAAGEFKAFSSVCTHKGCPVSKIAGDTIMCTCHGSQFSTKDGSVVKGPATVALAALPITEKNGELFLKG